MVGRTSSGTPSGAGNWDIHQKVDTEADASADQGTSVCSPGTVLLDQFHMTDSTAVRQFCAAAFTPAWGAEVCSQEGFSLTVHRQAFGEVTVDQFAVEGTMRCEAPTSDAVFVVQPRVGALTINGTPTTGTAPVLLIAQNTAAHTLQARSARFNVITIDAKLLGKVAAETNPTSPQQIEFLSSTPQSPTTTRAWHRTLDYVLGGFSGSDPEPRPLLVRAATRMLSAATLECFPSNANQGQDLPVSPSLSKPFRDAAAFMHQHAGHDIDLGDIAAAVNLTPRAVQYVFRQQADTTPMEYLRRMRLHRARTDLIDGDRSTTTVSAVAQKWKFGHTGRFAAQYRAVYGESPHTALAI